MANIEEKVEELLQPIIQNLEYELYDVEYVKEGKDFFLRIYIDNSKGIDLEDCEKVSNAISDILDKSDYIKEQYFLEVSSPGIERVLRKENHLKSNIGKKVEIKLYKAIEKQKQYEGILKEFDEGNVTIEIEKEIKTIDRKNVAQIKTVYNWDEE